MSTQPSPGKKICRVRRRGKGGAENFAQTQISSEYLLKVIGGFDPKPYDNIEKSSKMVVGKK